jgi:hypothetical protein
LCDNLYFWNIGKLFEKNIQDNKFGKNPTQNNQISFIYQSALNKKFGDNIKKVHNKKIKNLNQNNQKLHELSSFWIILSFFKKDCQEQLFVKKYKDIYKFYLDPYILIRAIFDIYEIDSKMAGDTSSNLNVIPMTKSLFNGIYQSSLFLEDNKNNFTHK